MEFVGGGAAKSYFAKFNNLQGRKQEAFLFRRKILISPPCSRSRSKGKKFTRFLSVKNYQIKQIL